MVTRDFDAMLAERAGIRPTFKVGGQEFTLRKRLAAPRWNRLLAAMRSDEADEQESTIDFFRAVIIPADRQRFAELAAKDNSDDEDDEDVIDISQMNDLVQWVVDVFTGKAPSNEISSTAGAGDIQIVPNVVSLSSKMPANAN
jgi:hypothetical protein